MPQPTIETKPDHRLVTVTVNNKPVKVPGPKATGLEIKEAAIAQGVEIELGFQLALIKPNGKREIVGDDDEVTVNKNSVFVATATDDNS
jgi:hypothetical protein